jgi:sugar phosphate isomerase/epimerase
MNNLKFSVMAAAMAEQLRDAPLRARTMGFSGIVFDAYSPRLNLAELSQSGRRDFKHLLSAQDQQLSALSVDIGPKGIGPGADVDRVIARLDTTMETAVGLGTRLVLCDIGPLPAPAKQEKPRKTIRPDEAGIILLPTPQMVEEMSARKAEEAAEAPDSAFMSQVDAALEEVGKRADRYGVTLAMRSELSSLSALERAIAASGCQWFGVDFDPVAMLRDVWDSDEVFSRLGAMVRHVRGRDASSGADRRTRPAVIGKGSVNWGELMGNLDEAHYQGWVTVDSMELENRAEAARVGVEYLKRL